MPKIEDTGTIWVRGTSKPEYAVRVEDKIFVVGKQDEEMVETWVTGESLCVDRHDRAKQKRIALRFRLNELPSNAGSPFSGFTKTSHKDVQVVTYEDAESFVIEGDEYSREGIDRLDSEKFFARSGL